MVRTAFQSDIFKSIVAKLSYCVRSSYQIIYSTDCGSYFVRKINKPDSTELKFMAYYLYTLLLFLKSCEHVDTTNIHYLKQTYIPLVNIFKRALHVKLYDENCFNKKIQTSAASISYKQDTLQFPNETSFQLPSVSELHKETENVLQNHYLK